MSQWAFPQLFPPYTGSSNDKTNVVWRGGGGAFRLSGWIEGEPITLTLMQRNGLAVIALLVGCRKWGSWHFVPNSLYPPCTPPPLDNKVHVHSQNLPKVHFLFFPSQQRSTLLKLDFPTIHPHRLVHPLDCTQEEFLRRREAKGRWIARQGVAKLAGTELGISANKYWPIFKPL